MPKSGRGTYPVKVKILESIIRDNSGKIVDIGSIVKMIEDRDYSYTLPPYFYWRPNAQEVGKMLGTLNQSKTTRAYPFAVIYTLNATSLPLDYLAKVDKDSSKDKNNAE